jgi:hypothetical protein
MSERQERLPITEPKGPGGIRQPLSSTVVTEPKGPGGIRQPLSSTVVILRRPRQLHAVHTKPSKTCRYIRRVIPKNP